MTRAFTGAAIALVGCMAVAQIARGEDWSPFAVALCGMLFGIIGTVVAIWENEALR